MPSVSPAQARLMRATAHGWKKPGGGGPSVSVAREFVAADKAKKRKGASRNRDERADRRRAMDSWAQGGPTVNARSLARMDT